MQSFVTVMLSNVTDIVCRNEGYLSPGRMHMNNLIYLKSLGRKNKAGLLIVSALLNH